MHSQIWRCSEIQRVRDKICLPKAKNAGEINPWANLYSNFDKLLEADCGLVREWETPGGCSHGWEVTLYPQEFYHILPLKIKEKHLLTLTVRGGRGILVKYIQIFSVRKGYCSREKTLPGSCPRVVGKEHSSHHSHFWSSYLN